MTTSGNIVTSADTVICLDEPIFTHNRLPSAELCPKSDSFSSVDVSPNIATMLPHSRRVSSISFPLPVTGSSYSIEIVSDRVSVAIPSTTYTVHIKYLLSCCTCFSLLLFILSISLTVTVVRDSEDYGTTFRDTGRLFFMGILVFSCMLVITHVIRCLSCSRA